MSTGYDDEQELDEFLEEGKIYCVRTLTDHWVGRLIKIHGPHQVELENAAWIADSGQLSVFIRDGHAAGMEVEYVGRMIVHWYAILEWHHECFKPEGQ